MGNLVDKINSIEDKIFKLLKSRADLKEENLDLKAQLKEKSDRLLKLEEKIEELHFDNQSLKTANALLGSKEFKRKTKFKINSLIRDIDHCIDQLSK